MKTIFENVIKRGDYDLNAMLLKIDTYHIEGKLTDDEKTELYLLAQQKPTQQYDIKSEIEKLWAVIREIKSQLNGEAGVGDEEEVAEFVQPSGASDAYQVGDKVIFDGDVYVSLINNNVWSPISYPNGWEVVE